MKHLAIYGGTFDPVHCGHLQTAVNIQNQFHFDAMQFIPCKQPLLKSSAGASAQQRLEMLELAINSLPAHYPFSVNPMEIQREGPSYMVTTLEQLREQYGNQLPITLIMGEDAFTRLPQWHQWQKLPKLCHILIMQRQGMPENQKLSPELAAFYQKHRCNEEMQLLKQSHGLIQRIDAGFFPESSTNVRQAMGEGRDISGLVPEVVVQYIKKLAIY